MKMYLSNQSTDLMKKIVIFISLILIISSCSSTRIVKKPPKFKLVESSLSKRIEITDKKSIPLEATTRFNVLDPEIVSHIKYANLAGKHNIRWEWYSPDGKLYLKTEDLSIHSSKNKYIKNGTVWHKIMLKNTKAETLPGDWKIKIFLDNTLLTVKSFLLIPRAADIDFGNYHALVIGNNNYTFIPKLQTAINDAKAVADTLTNEYRYNVTLLTDATRDNVIQTLKQLRNKLTTDDNLLIYYAGHGWFDKQEDEGYWLPIDSTNEDNANWISNTLITSSLKAINAKHILVAADSCYSGKLTRSIKDVHLSLRDLGYYFSLSRKRARTVLSSGGMEPVTDSGGKGDHSVFASAFLNVLSENKGIIDGTLFFNKLRHIVVLNSNQIPEYSDIRKSGHEGGDFLFVR